MYIVSALLAIPSLRWAGATWRSLDEFVTKVCKTDRQACNFITRRYKIGHCSRLAQKHECLCEAPLARLIPNTPHRTNTQGITQSRRSGKNDWVCRPPTHIVSTHISANYVSVPITFVPTMSRYANLDKYISVRLSVIHAPATRRSPRLSTTRAEGTPACVTTHPAMALLRTRQAESTSTSEIQS